MKHLLPLPLLALACLPTFAFEYVSGIQIDLPEGFDVRQLDPWEIGGEGVTGFVITTRDPGLSLDFGGELCRIGFARQPERSPLTQNDLNDAEAGDVMLELYRTLPVPGMKVLEAMPFIHGDIVGSELVATSKYTPDLTLLVSTMLTPAARTTVSCSAITAKFDASRPVFEAIRAGVIPPP